MMARLFPMARVLETCCRVQSWVPTVGRVRRRFGEADHCIQPTTGRNCDTGRTGIDQRGNCERVSIVGFGWGNAASQVPAPGQVELAWLKSLDLRASWQLKIRERFMIEPSVAFFNAFNFANFDGANNTLAQTLQSLNPQIPSPGPAANNTTSRTALVRAPDLAQACLD